MKRKMIACLLSAITVSALLLTGCNAETANTAASTSDTAPADAVTEAVTDTSTVPSAASQDVPTGSITIWTNLENEASVLQEYAKMWGSETGNTATVIHETPDLQQFSQATQSDDGPDGVFGIANDQLANYVSAGLAQELPTDLYNDSDYVNAAVQASYVDGKRYGVPIAVETITLYYNTDKVAAPPTTWEEMIELAKTTGGIQFEGTGIYYDIGFLRAFDSYIFKYENGAYDVTDIGLGNSGAVEAYSYLNSLAAEGFIGADITADIARGSFQNGDTAFYIGGPWDVEGFTSAGIPYATCKMPTLNGKDFVTPVGTQVGFVSAKSQKQDLVYDFYDYLLQNAGEALYEAGARIPAKISVQDNIVADENTMSFMEQTKAGEPLPTVSELGQVWTPYSDNMKLMFTGEITPQEAADYIGAQVQEGIDLMQAGQ
jgi:arabinogalactan oligomer/maltooligosaccharide transport system substrate-binding protein